MNEVIRLKCTVPLDLYEPDLDWGEMGLASAPIEFQKEGSGVVEFEWYVDDDDAADIMKCSLAEIPFLSLPESDRITSDDWQSYWKQHFHIQRIGRNILLVPEWEMDRVQPDAEDCLLCIRPGLGFGTGEHFTTSYCLAALENYRKEGDTFADVGTGSGILAAAAVKLGFRNVLAFDCDPLACRSAQDTFALNRVEQEVNLECCDLEERDPFCADLVCANLFDTTLIRFSELLTGSAARTLVLTGIRSEHADDVITAYLSRGCRLLDVSRGEEWCGLVFSTA